VYIGYISSRGWGWQTAKVFSCGNDQAIRLPKKFRFPLETDEVEIHREVLVLAPLQVEEWPESFWRAFGAVTEDFERPPQQRQQRERSQDREPGCRIGPVE